MILFWGPENLHLISLLQLLRFASSPNCFIQFILTEVSKSGGLDCIAGCLINPPRILSTNALLKSNTSYFTLTPK